MERMRRHIALLSRWQRGNLALGALRVRHRRRYRLYLGVGGLAVSGMLGSARARQYAMRFRLRVGLAR
jgi:hypothetical protein